VENYSGPSDRLARTHKALDFIFCMSQDVTSERPWRITLGLVYRSPERAQHWISWANYPGAGPPDQLRLWI